MVPSYPDLGSKSVVAAGCCAVDVVCVLCGVGAGAGTLGCVCLGASVAGASFGAAGCEDVAGCPGSFWAGSEGEAANDATVGVSGDGVGVGGAGIVGGTVLGAGLWV
jgi:hypothetical protein